MNERAIFEAALEIQDTRQRGEYLDQACANNPALRTRVETLLKSHAAAGSFLNLPVVDQMAPDSAPPPDRTTEFSSTPDMHEDDEQEDQLDLSFLQPATSPGSIGTLAHYKILQVLGRGGFGIVLKAFDEKLQRLVAIKAMNPQLAATSPPRKRFLREARAAAAIKHENIVQVYSVEEQPLPYLVMEYVDGKTLQQKLDGTGPLEVPEILNLGRQIASGLAAAHATGLIHRDIKPGNILLELGAEPKVKITDFGLARAADDASMTRTGVVSGTPMYMAPEQTLGQALDHRADLFSFGSVLYQMACGRPPFRASSTLAVLRRVAEDSPRPLQEILPEIPAWLAAIVAKLHAKKPEDRFQSAKEVADLLALCQAELHRHGSVESLPEIVQLTAQQDAAQPNGGPDEEDAQAANQVTLSKPTNPQSSHSSPTWVAALVVIFILCCGLGLTEATGVTNFRGTVVRLFSPDGTLVVEVDDPDVSITIDGEELVITGAGAKEIRLKPGQYKLLASKNGKVLTQELVTVTRNGRQVVRVSKEAEPIASSTTKSKNAFALQFQGSSCAVIPSLKLPTSDPMTLEALVQINEDRGPATLLGVPAFSLALENGLKLSHRCSLGPVGQTGELGSRKLTLGQLHHVAIVRDGSKHRLFLDGQVVARRSPQKGPLPESDQDFTIGGTGLSGVIQEVRVSKKARYDDAGFLFRPDARFEPDADTLALYHCDAGQGDVLKDFSGNNHHGKIVGAKWVPVPAASERTATEWVQLFNGKDLTAWARAAAGVGNWKVVEGSITCSGPEDYLYSERGDFGDFHLRAEVKINKVGNSGILFRASKPMRGGSEYEAHIANNLAPGGGELTGSLWHLAVVKDSLVPPDTWFTYEIIAQGNRMRLLVNGKETADFSETRAGRSTAGYIALQHHRFPGSEVHFRKIEVRELKESGSGPEASVFKNSLGMEFALVPTGKAWLGGSGGRPGDKEVEFQEDFYLGVYEVTQEEWEKVTGLNPGDFRSKEVPEADLKRFPVVHVSWIDCQEFIKQLNAKVKEAGWEYRLPTAAEWEYACRGGAGGRLDSAFDYYLEKPTNELLPQQANFNMALKRPAKVGSYPPNTLGLHDMHGNVIEWCADELKDDKGAPLRIHRGGCWKNESWGLKAGLRGTSPPTYGDNGFGLRVARVPIVADPDRRASKWVLSIGGSLRDGKAVAFKAGDEIPVGDWKLGMVNVTGNPQATDAGLTVFKGCRNIVSLYLSGTPITDDGLTAFHDCKDQLKALMLDNTAITDQGLALFKDHKHLEQLGLSGTRITDKGLVALGERANIGRLILGGTSIGDTGFAVFRNCKKLATIDLRNTRVTEAGLAQLRDYKELMYAHLDGLQIGDSALANFKDCKDMRELNLNGTQVGDAGLDHLKELKTPGVVRLKQTKVTAEGVKKLAAARPQLRIEWDGGVIEPK